MLKEQAQERGYDVFVAGDIAILDDSIDLLAESLATGYPIPKVYNRCDLTRVNLDFLSRLRNRIHKVQEVRYIKDDEDSHELWLKDIGTYQTTKAFRHPTPSEEIWIYQQAIEGKLRGGFFPSESNYYHMDYVLAERPLSPIKGRPDYKPSMSAADFHKLPFVKDDLLVVVDDTNVTGWFHKDQIVICENSEKWTRETFTSLKEISEEMHWKSWFPSRFRHLTPSEEFHAWKNHEEFRNYNYYHINSQTGEWL
jgi:hypothetical protein